MTVPCYLGHLLAKVVHRNNLRTFCDFERRENAHARGKKLCVLYTHTTVKPVNRSYSSIFLLSKK